MYGTFGLSEEEKHKQFGGGGGRERMAGGPCGIYGW